MGMEICSKFLRILAKAVRFTDRSWISKTMYLNNALENRKYCDIKTY